MNFIKSFRFKYFVSHLIISLIIATFSYVLIFELWYVKPFNIALGVSSIVLMMLSIDVLIGPILTLVIAKKGKKGLNFDLFIICLVQILALSYGLYTLEKARSVWVVFDFNRFELVQKYMVDKKNQNATNKMYEQEPLFSPKWVASRAAKNRQEQDDWMFYELEKGYSPASRPELYEPLSKNMDRVIEASQDLKKLYIFNSKLDVNNIKAKYPKADGFLPLKAADKDMTILINKNDKKLITVVNLTPW